MNAQKILFKRTLLSVLVGSLLSGSHAILAQEASGQEPEIIESIVIVGSRIAGTQIGGALPVTVVDQAQIDAIGAVSGEDLFRAIPQFGDVSFNQTSGQVSSNFARGDVGSVDLRNLGVGNTLPLINGRRGVNYPSSQASSNLAPVLTFNSNTVPVNGVRRVEVLRDGAGALYGSDAVAGVVNIVLQDDFVGARVDAQYGKAPGTQLDETNLNGLFGTDLMDGRGNITLFVNYTDRSALRVNDQTFTSLGDLRPLFVGTPFEGNTSLRNTSTLTPWGSFQTVGGVRVLQNGTPLTTAGGAFHVRPAINERCAATIDSGICIGSGNPAYTAADENMRWDSRENYPIAVSPDLNRLNLFTMGKYELDNGMELFGEGGYYVAETESVQDSVFSIGSIRMNIPASNYWNPFGPVTFADGTPNPNRLPGINAPAEGLPVSMVSYRFTDLGPTTVRVRAKQFRVLSGLRGETNNWDWETALLYSGASIDDRQEGVSSNALQANLALSTPDAFNPFNGGDPLNPGRDSRISSQAAIDAISIEANRQNRTTLFQWDANVSRSDLFQGWAGDVGVAAGVEFRRETQLDDRDPNVDGTAVWYDTVLREINESNLYGVSPTPDNYGSRKVVSAYAELAVPLVSVDMNIPLMQSLSMQLAGRYENYSDFGNVAKPKVALVWDMIDSLRFRGAYSEGFRAPNLEQVNATLVTRGNTRRDWVLCEADLRAGRIETFNQCGNANFVATARRAGNPDLKAEESTNWTAGVVIQPQFLPYTMGDMTLTLDYWSVKQKGIVGVFGEGNALIVDYMNRVQGTTNPAVQRREPTADDIARFAGTGLAPVGQVQYVDDVYQNLQPQSVNGVDLGFNWRIRGTNFGNFDYNLNVSRLLKYSRGVSDAINDLYDARAAGTINIATTLPESDDLVRRNGNPKIRLSSSLTWSYNQVRMGINANYVGSVFNTAMSDNLGNWQELSGHTNVNMYGQYNFDQGALGDSSIRVGVRNLFDKQPPLSSDAFGYKGALYSPTPRYYYVRLQTEF